NGWIVVTTKIPSFIVTLGTLLAYRGIARFIGGGDFAYYQEQEVPLLFTVLNGPITWLNQLSGDPAANLRNSVLWCIGFVVLATILMTRTRLGNWIYAVGGNPRRSAGAGRAGQTRQGVVFCVVGVDGGFGGHHPVC
ncbi:MAG: hypothetical protein HC853_17950, partial [Anaerolineae bacterium]|nr:hypothetical protein [Anaerolineae bacterium]